MKITEEMVDTISALSRLKLPEEETHIGGFEIDTCQRVIDLCRAKMDKK